MLFSEVRMATIKNAVRLHDDLIVESVFNSYKNKNHCLWFQAKLAAV